MDVTTLASIATAMSQEKTATAVQTAVLKKALDVQAQGALQLLQAATQSMQATNNPPHLGNNVNIFA
ncbi:MAG: YjfB family protein [Gammaproteobacteria bacterium]|nr:YjfB family protein [Gammaproteobacteria bacterium]MBU1646209.1 YjfB family protein [Gammaproteobacteria bacterium]MBU1972271.1 YjfB family protein [Gammaproteobacteria bacterium]